MPALGRAASRRRQPVRPARSGSAHVAGVRRRRRRAGPWASQVIRTHAGWLQVLRFRPGDSVATKDALPDPGGAIAAAFGLAEGGAALLRPDAYIAARFELGDNQALRHYLDLLGGVGQAEATANRERTDLPGVRWHPPSAVRS
ncbi:hypothetical protein [Lysobacter gummosus]|uniref:hypothetical protein n=1 Tax=Lysobacter gummosus TaxID=262324 RepID=UPI003638C95E